VIDAIRSLLEQSPLLALFAAIGLGYAVGRIAVAGFSLDIGAVLFAGLALGAIAPKAAPPALVTSIGLVMFLYGIGIQYGRQFFAGLRGAGVKWNLIAALGVAAALAVTLLLGRAAGLGVSVSMGLFAGGLTTTPALQAAIEAAGNSEAAIGYSAAYPIGVIGPILCLFGAFTVFAKRLAPPPAALQTLEATLDAPPGTVADLIAGLPPGVDVVAIRQRGVNQLPGPAIRLAAGDAVMLYGAPDALEQARQQLGHAAPGRIAKDRGALDLARIFVSRAAAAGVPIRDLKFPEGVAVKIVEVQRGDTAILADPNLVLELGDRVGLIAPRTAVATLRKYFGDSIKSTTEFSYVSVGFGMSLGVLIGLIPIPLPGVGTFSLGSAGGPLLASLVLGKLGRTGSWSWHMPLPANLTLRTFGLTIFLAGVGLGSGAPFVEAVARSGAVLLGIAAAVVLAAMLVAMLLAQYVFRLQTDDLLGVTAGVCSNPAIVAYANRLVASDRVDAAYAIVFPTAMILKILCAQVAVTLLK
jgi:putative transport protein